MRRALVSPSAARLAPPPLLLRYQHAALHASAPASSAILLGGLAVAGAALAARYALQKWDGPGGEGPASSAAPPSEDADSKDDGAAADGASSSSSSTSSAGEGSGEAKKARSFGADFLSKRFYRGGCEDKMTRREAALILGVRESATNERIRERHRKMLMLNLPDMGGSTYIAGKVNEAKDFFLKPQK